MMGEMSRVSRWLLAVLGVACFGLAAIGAVVPGLPTTVFVLVGSYFLTKSCPWLERRFVQSPLLRPFARYVDPNVPMPRRAKATAIVAMWISIAVTAVLLVSQHPSPSPIVFTVLSAGVVGTLAIVRFRRHLQQ